MESIEGGYRTVWTGRELLGWGMGLDAAYNPATNRRRKIATGGSAWAVMAWTSRQVLTWGGGCCGDDVAGGAAYTPSTNRWSRLPAGPLADPLPAQAELLHDAEVGRVERLLAAKYRIDLLFIRPIRALQARLRRRRPRPEPIIVALTPG